MLRKLIKLIFVVFMLLNLNSHQLVAQFPQFHNYTNSSGIFDFVIDGNDIWICSYGGLAKLNKSSGTYINYNGGNFGLTFNDLLEIEMDQSGALFMVGSNSVQTFDKDSLWEFTDTLTIANYHMPTINSCKSDKIGNVYGAPSSPYIIKYNNSNFDTIQLPFQGNIQVGAIAIDTSNQLWVASKFHGVAKYDGNNWQKYDSTNSILPNQYASGICVDQNNTVYALYFASIGLGHLYSFSNGIWTLEQSGIPIGNDAVEMFVDDANNIWITSESGVVNGIIKYDGTTITTIVAGVSGLPSNDINEFQIDDQGMWYYATDEGFYIFDGVTHRKFEISNSGAPNSMINKVVIDKHNVKWFASYDGVTRFDGYQWHTFTIANSSLSWEHITDIYADWDQDLIWVTFSVGMGNSGIAYYDGVNWNTITPTVSGGFHGGTSVTKDANGNMWFLGSGGVAKFDYSNWTFYNANVLNSNSISNIVADSSGNVFVGGYNNSVKMFNGQNWLTFDSSNFANPLSSLNLLYSGPGGQVHACNGGTIFVFDGTSWNIFNPVCIVQNPQFSLIAQSANSELWLSSEEKVSKYDGTSCEEFTISRLPDLSNYVNSVAKDQYNNYWITYFSHGGVTVYNGDGGVDPESLFGSPTFNASGFVYIDVASNGVYDSLTDLPFANRKILSLPDSNSRFTNAQGMYNFALDLGMYSFEAIQNAVWQLTTDSSEYNFEITGSDTAGFDFGFMDPTIPNDSLSIEISLGTPRCNTVFPVWIDYVNEGVNTQSGVIKVTCDNDLVVHSAYPQPDSTDGISFYWNVAGLPVFHSDRIILSMELDTFVIPAFLHSIDVELVNSGGVVATNTKLFYGLCALDPNDKIVDPVGSGPAHEIAPTQKLDYTIRFQNYGNDTAFYVMILDTLDANLDFNTFKINSSSHSCDVSLSSSGILIVKFKKINLLWEAIDTIGSNGYFRYSISPLSNIANNTVISNSAAIYFDLNMPVLTNEVFNTISYSITNIHENEVKDEFLIFPVPASNEIFISGGFTDKIVSFTIFDITGKQLSKEVLWQQNQSINIGHLKSGSYFIRIKTNSGRSLHARFVVNHQNRE